MPIRLLRPLSLIVVAGLALIVGGDYMYGAAAGFAGGLVMGMLTQRRTD